MARTKKKRKASGHTSAGRKKNPARRHHRRRSNPSGLPPLKSMLELGGGAVIGSIGATSLPQMILSSSNTGAVGYLGNAAATALLAIAANMFFKRPALTSGVVAGGIGALIRRVMQDYSIGGQLLNASGMGDIITDWNFGVPQTIAPGGRSLRPVGGGAAIAAPAIPAGANLNAGVGFLY